MAAFTAFGNLIDRVNTLESLGSFNLLSDLEATGPTGALNLAEIGSIGLLQTSTAGNGLPTDADVITYSGTLTHGQIFRLFHTGPTDSPYYEITFTDANNQVVTIYPQEAYSLIYNGVDGEKMYVIPGIINAGNNHA